MFDFSPKIFRFAISTKSLAIYLKNIKDASQVTRLVALPNEYRMLT